MENPNMEEGNIEIPKYPEVNKKSGKLFLIAGIVIALANALLLFLNLPVVGALNQVTGITILIAIILLFIKKYRYIGKKYLLGLIGTLIAGVVVGFVLTLILVAIKK